MKILAALLAVFLALPSMAQAAIIKGSVYDLGLEKVGGALIEVDSSPQQQFVTRTGDYNFSLGKGNYTITAKKIEGGTITAIISENISVASDGEFNLDLILFPVFEDDVLGNTTLNLPIDEREGLPIIVFVGFAAIALALVGLYFSISKIRKQKPEIRVVKEIVKPEVRVVKETIREIKEVRSSLPEDLEKTVGIIKAAGGRANQKDIRKELNLSEAKVSLMIADLEGRGLVKKIKKGRGNIIVFN